MNFTFDVVMLLDMILTPPKKKNKKQWCPYHIPGGPACRLNDLVDMVLSGDAMEGSGFMGCNGDVTKSCNVSQRSDDSGEPWGDPKASVEIC